MKLIESKTLATAAASIEFTSIPQTFTDLVFVINIRSTLAENYDDQLRVKFNTSTANFTNRQLQGNGSTTNSFSGSDPFIGYIPSANRTANTFGNAQMYVPNYTASTNKSASIDAVTENNATTAIQTIFALLWSNSAAITGVSFNALEGNLAAGSMVSLYGILKGSDGIVTTS